MLEAETLPSEEHISLGDGSNTMPRQRFCTIPLLAVIFLKTFVTSLFVVVVPLIISFAAMEAANELSTSSGRAVAQSLAVQIHSAEASLALERIDSFVRNINEQTEHMHKSISAHANQSNLDSILGVFANEVKYKGYNSIMYYGRQDDAFLQLEVTARRAIWITTPAGDQDRDCLICQQLRDSLTRANISWDAGQNTSAAWADWDQESFKAVNVSLSDQTYHCTQRPWYRQASLLNPDNVRVQFTEPYMFAGGISSALAGITVNIPFFDAEGRLTGVYGSDITFTDMHRILTEFLQSETAFMYVMTRDGQLVASSSNETLVDSDGNLIRANKSASPWTRSTAQFLWKLETSSGREKDFTKLDGLRWELEDMSFQLRAMEQAPYFVIVNGALKGDYLTTINDLKKELEELRDSCLHMLVGISAVCFVVVVGMTISFNYVAVVRPLEQITSVMVHAQAARLDFTALAKMSQQYRTLIYEISQMETEFFGMVANFANSAKESQGLLRVGAKNAFIFQSSETHETENARPSSTAKKSRFSIPVMVVVFLQSLVAGTIMTSTTLSIFFPAMAHSNVHSTNTSRQIVDSLALKIQHLQGHLAEETIRSMIASINETTLEMRKVISAYSNQSSLDSVFRAFEQEVQHTKSQLTFLYGHVDGAMLSLQHTAGRGVFVALPLNSSYSSCIICAKSQSSFSSDDCWNSTSGELTPFEYTNITYRLKSRPWYLQGASLNAMTAKVQFTDPYVYAVGSKGSFSNFATGLKFHGDIGNLKEMHQTYPFFNSSGGLDGVFALDMSFSDVHNKLKPYLQSPNAFIYVATREGILVGTSTNETMFDSAGNLVRAPDSRSASIRTTGKYLWNQRLARNNSNFSTLSNQMLEDQGYLFQLRVMTHAPYFVIVNGAPKTDYTKDIDLVLSDLDASLAFITKVVIAISSAVFVLSVVVSNIWTYYFIVLPLSKVTAGLREASNFDFSAYKPLQKQKFNHIREICTMEHVFYMMIAKFAASIRGSNGVRSSTADGSGGPKRAAGSAHEKKGASRVERHSRISVATGPKLRRRPCSIPLLVIVFLQTLIVATVVLIIPLFIAISTMSSSNALSTSTGKRVAESLAVKIQSAEASLAVENIGSFIRRINKKTMHMRKAISLETNLENLESLLRVMANDEKYTGYKLPMFYGTRSDAFVQIQQTGSRAIWMWVPANYTDIDCKLCQLYTQNFTAEERGWGVSNGGFSAFADWDEDSMRYSNFEFTNSTYHCTQRPWYKQAVSLSPDDVHLQYTHPYLYGGGSAVRIAVVSKITHNSLFQNMPFFDHTKTLAGVYGSDISFADMSNTLAGFLATNNSFMYLMTPSGQLVGSSLYETLTSDTGDLILAIDSSADSTRRTAQVLWSLSDSDEKNFTTLDGRRWDQGDFTFQIRALGQDPHFVIVNGAPKSDYSEQINSVYAELKQLERETTPKMIGMSVAGFFVVVLVSSLFKYLSIIRPLARISSIMVEATQLDFSNSAETSAFKSHIKELAAMGSAFSDMISKFAESVEETQSIQRIGGAQNAFMYHEIKLFEGPETAGRKKQTTPKQFTISLLLAAIAVLSTPLCTYFPLMAFSNNASTTATRAAVEVLADKIQQVQVSLAMETITSLIDDISDHILDMRKVFTVYSNHSDMDAALYALANEIKFTNFPLNMLFATVSDACVFLQKSDKYGLTVVLPPDYRDPQCEICRRQRQNWTDAEYEWTRRNNVSISAAVWNETLWDYGPFEYQNVSYRATLRPWFKQAALLTPANARIQFTEPYLYALGTRGNLTLVVSGITATYPFFDALGQLSAVYGVDISFEDLHDTLAKYLQTPNAFMYITTREGLLVGSSSNESLIDSAGNMMFANQSMNTQTRITSEFLWSQFSSGVIDLSLLGGKLWDHEGLSFQLRAMSDAPHFVIVNGAPKSDYTGDFDAVLADLDLQLGNNLRIMIGVSSTVFAVAVLISCILARFYVTIPLAHITRIIEDAAHFDFTSYKSMRKSNGNFIREIATMEQVFFVMIAKFAASVRGSTSTRLSEDVSFTKRNMISLRDSTKK
ncbi:hypothetical protein CcCBS67573_g06219 [Chytriomyces confervae]|uniref:HAMP domain-containing protein n=1 Tax=Chytriomyces confervae TaxID=246404 RepID=A0A507F6L7_9FUNG|nr:hypothetical protein CcCBS67573_g06219 [Chytriomyces confervae]